MVVEKYGTLTAYPMEGRMTTYDDWKLSTPRHYDAVTRCVCGCRMDDHYEPDMYDMGNVEAEENGHLNYCGDCANCFAPEVDEEPYCCDSGLVGHAGKCWKEE